MDFVKMEGLGNDFIVLDGPLSPAPTQVADWCDRRRGIGADGVLVVTAGPPVAMEYWNADGSPAEMCGNGLRCVAVYAVDRGIASPPEFEVGTPAGVRRVQVGDDSVRVELGPVEVDATQVSLAGYELTPVAVGNPHAVAFVNDCYAVPVEASGPLVESDPSFPERTNVEFATIVGPKRIDLRVWERGVGETLACGSGAAAAVAVGVDRGLIDSRVEVMLPGGRLDVEIIDGVAWITGPARIVYSGTLA
jgi:diaminopimelate epimerase